MSTGSPIGLLLALTQAAEDGPPVLPTVEYQPPPPRGGGFGGGWGYNSNKRIRKPGESEAAPEPDDIRELLLDQFGREKLKPVELRSSIVLPPKAMDHPVALAQLARALAEMRKSHIDNDEADVQILLLDDVAQRQEIMRLLRRRFKEKM